MRFDIVTIFPALFTGPFDHGVVRRAVEGGLVKIGIHDLRSWTSDKHHVVDDRPFGGGAGMVLKPEPLVAAVESLKDASNRSTVVLTTPQGKLFDQKEAARLAEYDQVVVLCGRYEGVDERVVEAVVDEEYSIGDVVLSGGELAAAIIVDATTRLLPGVLGCEDSASEDSFSNEAGLLDYPHYTRPSEFRGLKVPEVLLGGNHAEIARWRRQQALERTSKRRPDLFERLQLSDEDREFLDTLNENTRR